MINHNYLGVHMFKVTASQKQLMEKSRKELMDEYQKAFLESLNPKDGTQPEHHECHLSKRYYLLDDDLSDCECN